MASGSADTTDQSGQAGPSAGTPASKICIKCRKVIAGNAYIEITGNIYHAACFVCTKCSGSLLTVRNYST